MDRISYLLDVIRNDIGINNHLVNIISNAISTDPKMDAYDNYVSRYGAEPYGNLDSFSVSERLVTIDASKYNYEKMNQEYHSSVECIKKEMKIAQKDLDSTKAMIDRYSIDTSDENMQYTIKVLSMAVEKYAFYDRYFCSIDNKFIQIATNPAFSQD
jgi:hypothetical protein